MIISKSFNVQIWCGLQVGYDSSNVHPIGDAITICDRFVNHIRECVTVTKTSFRYVNGNEDGFVVGFIIYPRFEQAEDEITDRALRLANELMVGLDQLRVTVTTPKFSYMLENEKFIEKNT